MPLNKSGRNSFGGLGATIIDSLDTLHMLGMKAEFKRCVFVEFFSQPGIELSQVSSDVVAAESKRAHHLKSCKQHLLLAEQSKATYVPWEPSSWLMSSHPSCFCKRLSVKLALSQMCGSGDWRACRAQDWVAKDFDLAHAGRLSLFETIIRIVGGLIAAFDASGDQIFLQKALELAQKLQVNFPEGGKGTHTET